MNAARQVGDVDEGRRHDEKVQNSNQYVQGVDISFFFFFKKVK